MFTLSFTTLFKIAILKVPSLLCFPTEHLSSVKHIKYISYLPVSIPTQAWNFLVHFVHIYIPSPYNNAWNIVETQ